MERRRYKPCAAQDPIWPEYVERCDDCRNYVSTTEADEIAVMRWLWENPTVHECVIRKFEAQIKRKERYLRSDYVHGNRMLIFAWQCMATTKTGYEIYLNSDHWRFVRRYVIDVMGENCKWCGSTEHLNVHHYCYEHIGHERIGCLVPVCVGCHKHFHVGAPEHRLGGRRISNS